MLGHCLTVGALPDNWGIVEEKVYPMTYDEAVATAALHFTELGVAATIVATILFVNAVSAFYLRRRIQKEGRFFEPFASEMQDSEWVDEDEGARLDTTRAATRVRGAIADAIEQ